MPKIFLSYRRHDTQAIVGRLYDRLIAKFGKNEVIRDLDSIPLGVDFRQFLSDSVAKCNVLIAVIGDDWKGVSQDGRSRIDDESDFVRIEIASALTRGIPVIPVLVDKATMPPSSQLPAALKNLTFRHAYSIESGVAFDDTSGRLIRGIAQLLGEKAEQPNQSLVNVINFVYPGNARYSDSDRMSYWGFAIKIDGQSVGSGSLDLGFNFTAQVTPGRHILGFH